MKNIQTKMHSPGLKLKQSKTLFIQTNLDKKFQYIFA